MESHRYRGQHLTRADERRRSRLSAYPAAILESDLELLRSVVAIDEPNGTVTVKAPDGTVETVKARNPKNLKQLKVGDDLVVTLSRAVAISLEKGPAG